MPDATPAMRELTVAEALARLPLESPPAAAWPVLAASLPAPRARWRWPVALAAAALALLAVIPGYLAPPPGATATAPVPTSAIEPLMAQSAQLETLLGVVSNQGMATASATLLGLAFEDQLQQIDDGLAQPGLTPAQRAALWERRVAVLREYASVLGTHQRLAANGSQLDGILVATY